MKTEPCSHCNGTGQQIDQQAFGLEMRNKRISRKKSLREIAELMDISAPYLSDLELGGRVWNAGLIARFQLALKGIAHRG